MKPWILIAALASSHVLATSASAAAPERPKSGLPDPNSVWDWRVRPAVGARYLLRTFTRTENTVRASSMGQADVANMSIASQQRSTADYEILGRDAKNATTIRITYRTFEVANSVVGGPVASPAAQKSLRAMQDSQNKMLRDVLVGLPITFKVAQDGQVWSVIGLDKLRARLSQAASALPGGALAAAQISSMDFLSDEAYKKSLSQKFGALPAHAIAPGDAWPYETSLKIGALSTQVNGERLLLSRRAGLATIKEIGAFKITGDQIAGATKTDALPPSVVIDISGTLNGGTIVDEASGLTLESNSVTVMSGSVSVPPSPTGAPTVAGSASASSTLSVRITARTVLEPVAR